MRAKTIGLVAHTGKPGVAELTRNVRQELQQRGLAVCVERASATVADLPDGASLRSAWMTIAAATIGRGRVVVTGYP